MAESNTIVSNWKSLSAWSTELLPSNKQFGRWCEFVNHAHSHWSIEREQFDRFPAFIREGRFGDFRIATLTAPLSRIRGNRGQLEINRDADALYNILYVAEGAICLVIDGRDVEVHAGDVVLWDSTRPMTFITGEGLRQVTLCVAHDRLHRIYPNAGELVGKSFSCSSGLSRLFADHLLALDQKFGDLTCDQAWTVLDTSISLAISAFEAQNGDSRKPHASSLLADVCEYIERNIEDFDLSIPNVAQKHSISVRHLHRLFRDIDISASAYIIGRRLERCKHDLSSRAHSRETITDIAFRWGFADSGTFSKTFRREYGLTPRQFRSMNCG